MAQVNGTLKLHCQSVAQSAAQSRAHSNRGTSQWHSENGQGHLLHDACCHGGHVGLDEGGQQAHHAHGCGCIDVKSGSMHVSYKMNKLWIGVRRHACRHGEH
eukprot:1160501-Pelagomonas_calceolata.AAC.1